MRQIHVNSDISVLVEEKKWLSAGLIYGLYGTQEIGSSFAVF